MTIDTNIHIEEFRRNGQGDTSGGGRDLRPLVEEACGCLHSDNVTWPATVPWRQREALAREFTIVRAHICGVPAGPYGTAGHRDLARKAERLTMMERALLQNAPAFEPAAYVDVILAYWEALATKHVTYRFMAVLLETLAKPG